jgi:hypothetical protein
VIRGSFIGFLHADVGGFASPSKDGECGRPARLRRQCRSQICAERGEQAVRAACMTSLQRRSEVEGYLGVAEKTQVNSAVGGRNGQRLGRSEDLKSGGTANESAQKTRDERHQAEVRQMKSGAVARRHAASREASLLAKDQLRRRKTIRLGLGKTRKHAVEKSNA